MPSEVGLLLRKRKIDILSSSIHIEKLEEVGNYVTIILTKESSSINRIGIRLFNNLSFMSSLIASFENRQIKFKLKKEIDYLEKLEKALTIINSTCNNE